MTSSSAQMGNRNVKCFAVVFILLLVGYYQSWVFVIVYEMLSKETDASAGDLNQNVFSSSLNLPISRPIDEDQLAADEARPKFTPTSTKVLDDPGISLQLSRWIQQYLHSIQSSKCRSQRLRCGAPTDCGLGCQAHYLIHCLMIAASLNFTLIPDFTNWPYKNPWNDYLQPINPLNCAVDSKMTVVVWQRNYYALLQGPTEEKRIKSGLPIPKDFGKLLKASLSNPLQWYIAQVANFTLRPQLWTGTMVSRFKTEFEFESPMVGVLLRRRDKKGEKKQPLESVDRYMSAAKKYFDTTANSTGSNFSKNIYVATDDPNVLRLLKKRYRLPKWNIIGAQEDNDEVEEIVRDIFLLSQCDFVVCSYSSDICRLATELKWSRDPPVRISAKKSVKSFSSPYNFQGKDMNKIKFVFL